MKLYIPTYLISGFLLGVFIHSLFFEVSITSHVLYCLAILVLLSPLIWYRNRLFILVFIFLLSYIGGLIRFSDVLLASSRQQEHMARMLGRELLIEGQVISEPLQKKNTKQFVIEAHSIDSVGVNPFKVLVYTDPYQSISYGDIISMYGELTVPENFVTDSGRVFDYSHYLLKDGIGYTIFSREISVGSDAELSLYQKIVYELYSVKELLVKTISKRLPQPESGLLAGILFGQKDALDEKTNDQFRRVGLMHIVVLSGYNVSLVITLIMKLLYFLPLRLRSILAILGIISFALLVGAGPTVVRASIMALFIVLSENVGRRYDVQRGLVAAGVAMVLVNPWVLLFDLSFQLSFLATYGLITFSPFFEHWLRWIPRFLELRASAVATLSAQVIVTPLLLYSIGELSIISPIVNVAVLFAVPWAMLFGFIISLPWIPDVFSVILYLPLKYTTWLVEYFAETPLAVITFPPFHALVMVGMYVLIGLWLFYLKRRFKSHIV